MGFFNEFPYSNFHDLNLDWLLNQVRELRNYIDSYVAVNSVSYGGLWDISKNYPKWTIVYNDNSTYMSISPVPQGANINDENYWLHLADLDPRVAELVTQMANANLQIDKINNKIDSVKVHNIVDYGASTSLDNNHDAVQAAIQAAHDDGGVVYIPAGVYKITQTLHLLDNVSIYGENMRTTEISVSGVTCLDTTNASINGVVISGFTISNSGSKGVSCGILGGSSIAKYNSAIAVFKNILITGFSVGIDGSSEPSGVGLFDSVFENIWVDSCNTGLKLCGSQNVIIQPRMTNCDTGIAITWLNGESYDGGVVLGGVFILNNYDISIPNSNGHRPYTFVNCWFEQSKYGIINIPYANTKGLGLSFITCMFNTNSTVYDLFNTNNYTGLCKWYNCTVIQTVSNGNTYISPNVEYDQYTFSAFDGSRKIVRNCVRGSATLDLSKEPVAFAHNLGTAPSVAIITPVGSDAPPLTVAAKFFDVIQINKPANFSGTCTVDYILYK